MIDKFTLSADDRKVLENYSGKRADILRLLDDKIPISYICQRLNVGAGTVCKVKRLYISSGLLVALGISEKVEIHPYILGVLWSIGRYEAKSKCFILRHSDSYFLTKVKEFFKSDSSVRFVSRNYVLKLGQYCFDIDSLKQYGWTERNSEDRTYPNIKSHKDFIRGYFEIHGRISEVASRNRKGRIQVQKRLRIYGNESLLQTMNEIISFELGISQKKLEKTSKEYSKVLGYYKATDSSMIIDWLYQEVEDEWKYGVMEGKFREIVG